MAHIVADQDTLAGDGAFAGHAAPLVKRAARPPNMKYRAAPAVSRPGSAKGQARRRFGGALVWHGMRAVRPSRRGLRPLLRVRFRSVIHVNRAIMRRIIASLTKASLTAGRCS